VRSVRRHTKTTAASGSNFDPTIHENAYVQSAAAQADGAKAQLSKSRHDRTAAAAGIARLLELVEK